MEIIYMVRQCGKSFEIVLKKVKATSKFNGNFIKNYSEESDELYFLEVDSILKNCENVTTIYHFYSQE